jgi:hypothetical protein|tara:strand:+ start:412 stop:717 length:306 start_codon:yes stop_codon:yes gene_type:complete
MAIQINILEGSSQYGIAFNNAYYRIATAAVSRQRGDDPKFTVMIDLSAYATATPGDDTREVDFKRYNANLTDIEAATGTTFLDKCYAWVMAQDDMTGSSAV